MFATQVIDDRLEEEQPDQEETLEDQGDHTNAEAKGKTPGDSLEEQPAPGDSLDGL
jgi:hypothetical protein